MISSRNGSVRIRGVGVGGGHAAPPQTAMRRLACSSTRALAPGGSERRGVDLADDRRSCELDAGGEALAPVDGGLDRARRRRRRRPGAARSGSGAGACLDPRQLDGVPRADRGDVEGQHLELLAGDRVAVEALVLGLERLRPPLEVVRVSSPPGIGTVELPVLADVAHVDRAHELRRLG